MSTGDHLYRFLIFAIAWFSAFAALGPGVGYAIYVFGRGPKR